MTEICNYPSRYAVYSCELEKGHEGLHKHELTNGTVEWRTRDSDAAYLERAAEVSR